MLFARCAMAFPASASAEHHSAESYRETGSAHPEDWSEPRSSYQDPAPHPSHHTPARLAGRDRWDLVAGEVHPIAHHGLRHRAVGSAGRHGAVDDELRRQRAEHEGNFGDVRRGWHVGRGIAEQITVDRGMAAALMQPQPLPGLFADDRVACQRICRCLGLRLGVGGIGFRKSPIRALPNMRSAASRKACGDCEGSEKARNGSSSAAFQPASKGMRICSPRSKRAAGMSGTT